MTEKTFSSMNLNDKKKLTKISEENELGSFNLNLVQSRTFNESNGSQNSKYNTDLKKPTRPS